MSARKRSSSRVFSTPPWRRYSNAWATAPAGASESSASSASGSASPPSRISAIPSRSQIARSCATPSGHARRPPSRRTTIDPRAGGERLDVVDRRVRAADLREVLAELAAARAPRRGSRCRRSSGDGASGASRRDHGQPFRGAMFDEFERGGRVDVRVEPVGEPVELRLAHVGEGGACRASSRGRGARRPRCSSARRNASPSSRPCQAVPRTSPCCEQRRRRGRRGRGGSRSRSPRRPRRVPLTRRSSFSRSKRVVTGSSPRPSTLAGVALDLVLDRAAEHLVAAADAEDRAAARLQRAVEPVGAQPLQVLDGRLRAGEDDEVGALDVGGASA